MDLETAAANEPGVHPGLVLHDLPVFPLPNAVLFPNTLLPLHVFEPRYQQLLRRVMTGDKRIAIALLAPGWEPQYYGAPEIHPVMGLGEVISHNELSDGRSNILVRGLARVHVLEEQHTGLEYRTVKARVAPAPTTASDQLDRHLATVRQLFAHVVARIPHVDLNEAEVLFQKGSDPVLVLDAIASAAPGSPQQKQLLLAEACVDRRALMLADLLAEVVTSSLGAPRPEN
jgi:uncharacterized protein